MDFAISCRIPWHCCTAPLTSCEPTYFVPQLGNTQKETSNIGGIRPWIAESVRISPMISSGCHMLYADMS